MTLAAEQTQGVSNLKVKTNKSGYVADGSNRIHQAPAPNRSRAVSPRTLTSGGTKLDDLLVLRTALTPAEGSPQDEARQMVAKILDEADIAPCMLAAVVLDMMCVDLAEMIQFQRVFPTLPPHDPLDYKAMQIRGMWLNRYRAATKSSTSLLFKLKPTQARSGRQSVVGRDAVPVALPPD